jgi:hypothetical protein
MSGGSSESEVKATYPNCRCVDLTKPVCFFCEDTLDEDSKEDEDTKEKDNGKRKKQVLG